jgi:DNA-binding MarR family transcriptional regulator
MSGADIHAHNAKSQLRSYKALAELRYQIRRFLHFSEQAARKARIEPQQHQFLLALKGLPESMRPSMGILAERLQIQPNSAVELVNRSVKRGLVERRRGNADGREVLLVLTGKGESVLQKLSLHHQAELEKAGPALITALHNVLELKQPQRTKTEKGKKR